MKKKSVILLIASLSTASLLLLGGCGGIDLTDIGTEQTTLSVEMEGEDLTDGTCQIHGVFYGTDGNLLANTAITVSEDGKTIYSGSTDESGVLEGFTFSANVPVTITVQDGSESISSTIVCKLSSAYEDITIYPVHGEENKELVLEVPVSKTDMRAAIFITDADRLAIANVSPYIDHTATTTEDPDNTAPYETIGASALGGEEPDR